MENKSKQTFSNNNSLSILDTALPIENLEKQLCTKKDEWQWRQADTVRPAQRPADNVSLPVMIQPVDLNAFLFFHKKSKPISGAQQEPAKLADHDR